MKYFDPEYKEDYSFIKRTLARLKTRLSVYEKYYHGWNGDDIVGMDYQNDHEPKKNRFFQVRFMNNVKNPLSLKERKTFIGGMLKGIADYIETRYS